LVVIVPTSRPAGGRGTRRRAPWHASAALRLADSGNPSLDRVTARRPNRTTGGRGQCDLLPRVPGRRQHRPHRDVQRPARGRRASIRWRARWRSKGVRRHPRQLLVARARSRTPRSCGAWRPLRNRCTSGPKRFRYGASPPPLSRSHRPGVGGAGARSVPWHRIGRSGWRARRTIRVTVGYAAWAGNRHGRVRGRW